MMNWKQKILTLVALAACIAIVAHGLWSEGFWVQGFRAHELNLINWHTYPGGHEGSWGITEACADLVMVAVCYVGLFFVLGDKRTRQGGDK